MDKFNPYILLVIRWLQNPDLVSEEELKDNYDDAYDAYDAYAAAAEAAADAAASACNAAYFADATANVEYWLNKTKEYLNRYFKLTNENRETYKNRAKYLNILGVKNE